MRILINKKMFNCRAIEQEYIKSFFALREGELYVAEFTREYNEAVNVKPESYLGNLFIKYLEKRIKRDTNAFEITNYELVD